MVYAGARWKMDDLPHLSLRRGGRWPPHRPPGAVASARSTLAARRELRLLLVVSVRSSGLRAAAGHGAWRGGAGGGRRLEANNSASIRFYFIRFASRVLRFVSISFNFTVLDSNLCFDLCLDSSPCSP